MRLVNCKMLMLPLPSNLLRHVKTFLPRPIENNEAFVKAINDWFCNNQKECIINYGTIDK